MKLSDEKKLEYARIYSRVYLAKFPPNHIVDEDDAFSIAYLEMCEFEYDENASEGEIRAYAKKKILGKITRQVQDYYKTRCKSSIKIVPIDDNFPEKVVSDDPEEEFDWAVGAALDKLLDYQAREIVCDILDGIGTHAEIAKKYGLSRSRVTQIYGDFKRAAKEIVKAQTLKVLLVSPKDFIRTLSKEQQTELKEKMPLFL